MESRDIAVREARARFAELIDDAGRGAVSFVTRHGRRAAAIAPAELVEQFMQVIALSTAGGDSGTDLVVERDDGSIMVCEVKSYRGPTELADHHVDRERSDAVVSQHVSAGKNADFVQLIQELTNKGGGVVIVAATSAVQDVVGVLGLRRSVASSSDSQASERTGVRADS